MGAAVRGGGRKPETLDEREIGEILATFGRREGVSDRQFVQLVEAVRHYLGGLLALRAASRVDWDYWRGSARTLAVDHASTARESTPEELLRRKIRRGTGSLAEVRRRHEDLVVRFVTEIRTRGYAYRTEQVYEHWVCRYIAFCGDKSPESVGADAVAGFLGELVVSGNVSASTQNQALNALVFLYKHVLLMPLGRLEDFARSKRKQTVPVVLTRLEIRQLEVRPGVLEMDDQRLHVGYPRGGGGKLSVSGDADRHAACIVWQLLREVNGLSLKTEVTTDRVRREDSSGGVYASH